MSATDRIVEVAGVAKSFDGLEVLRDISFSVAQTEFVCIFGPSGCGKSTLFRLLCHLDAPDRGTITVSGRSAADDLEAYRRLVSIVWQDHCLIPWRSAIQNITFALELRFPERSHRQNCELAQEALANVGLADFGDRLPIELSGGMKQRVNLARALCLDPPVILMDEPLANLNEVTEKRALIDQITSLWTERKKVILYVTHSINEAIALADRILVCSEKPTVLRSEIPVPLPRPRDLASTEAARVRTDIAALFDRGLVE